MPQAPGPAKNTPDRDPGPEGLPLPTARIPPHPPAPAPAHTDPDTGAQARDEEYKLWLSYAPLLYDHLAIHTLDWPSYTVEVESGHAGLTSSVILERVLVGTHTLGVAPNYVLELGLCAPSENALRAPGQLSDPDAAVAGSNYTLLCAVPHAGPVRRARRCPEARSWIAVRGDTPEVLLVDLNRHTPTPTPGAPPAPLARLTGLQAEGFSLCWSTGKPNMVAAADVSGQLCVWDATVPDKPIACFRASEAAVDEVCWLGATSDVLVSVGQAGYAMVWDLRTRDPPVKPTSLTAARTSAQVPAGGAPALIGQCTPDHPAMTALAASPHRPLLVFSGCETGAAHAWDIRNFVRPFYAFEGHSAPVYSVAASPFHASVFLSVAADCRAHVWDMARIGLSQSVDEAEDGPPELLFVHAGHTAAVYDACWSPNMPWTVVSVAENNSLIAWQMAEAIYLKPLARDARPAPAAPGPAAAPAPARA